MAERIYLTAKDKITANENNLVNLVTADGRSFSELEPRRLFPVSAGDKYVSLLDTEGIEIAIIRDLRELNTESRAVVDASLADYYLVPIITKILNTTNPEVF